MFSIFGVGNYNPDTALESLEFKDIPYEGLNFRSIKVPAYEMGESVIYTIRYKLASSGEVQVLPGGENLTADVRHQIRFQEELVAEDYVEEIYVDFGTVPVGFKPINNRPIVVNFRLSDDIEVFIPFEEKVRIALNEANLNFVIGSELTTLSAGDLIFVREKCIRECKRVEQAEIQKEIGIERHIENPRENQGWFSEVIDNMKQFFGKNE